MSITDISIAAGQLFFGRDTNEVDITLSGVASANGDYPRYQLAGGDYNDFNTIVTLTFSFTDPYGQAVSFPVFIREQPPPPEEDIYWIYAYSVFSATNDPQQFFKEFFILSLLDIPELRDFEILLDTQNNVIIRGLSSWKAELTVWREGNQINDMQIFSTIAAGGLGELPPNYHLQALTTAQPLFEPIAAADEYLYPLGNADLVRYDPTKAVMGKLEPLEMRGTLTSPHYNVTSLVTMRGRVILTEHQGDPVAATQLMRSEQFLVMRGGTSALDQSIEYTPTDVIDLLGWISPRGQHRRVARGRFAGVTFMWTAERTQTQAIILRMIAHSATGTETEDSTILSGTSWAVSNLAYFVNITPDNLSVPTEVNGSPVTHYTVQVLATETGEADIIITPELTCELVEFEPDLRTMAFVNSLGMLDTVLLTGQATSELSAEQSVSETAPERRAYNAMLDDEWLVSTGPLKAKDYNGLKDLYLSDDRWIFRSPGRWDRVIILSDDHDDQSDMEEVYTHQFTIVHSVKETNGHAIVSPWSESK